MLRKLTVLLLGVMLLGLGSQASARGFSLSLGTDDFYLSVGNYDYYPYTLPYSHRTPRISFHNVMSDYGAWVSMAPFGQVWRPYVHHGWRPFTQGHWNYTRYGPTWSGYEPWAWVGYHYGNWIWSSRFGWVWIPGYDWHPGRVIWSHGYDSIGWMPAPPSGYDYSRGYLDYRGSHNQFDYYDNDFDDYDDYYGDDYYDDDYYGDSYNSGYGDLFYGSGYRNIVVNLWIFIDSRHYGYNNYSDYYLDSDYTRTLFDRRRVRISSRPLQRATLERIVKQKIRETPVQVREIETNNRKVKVIVPSGEEENIRRNANRVVKNVIAPAFAEKKRNFKGLEAENASVVNKVFKQETRQPKIRKMTEDEVLRDALNQQNTVEQKRKNFVREKTDKVIRAERPEKTRENKVERKEKDAPLEIDRNRGNENRDSQFKAGRDKKEPELDAESNQRQKNRDAEYKMKQEQQKKDRQNRDAEFEAKQNQKNRDAELRKQIEKAESEFKTKQDRQNRDAEFKMKQDRQKQDRQNREDQFKAEQNKKNRKEFEAAPAPKERDRSFESTKSREQKREKDLREPNTESDRFRMRKPEAEERHEPVAPESTVEKQQNKKQDQETGKKKVSSQDKEEQVAADEQNDDDSKSKKKKKEDSKKKKPNQD